MDLTIHIDSVDEVIHYSNAGITDIISIGSKGSRRPQIKHFGPETQFYRYEFEDVFEDSPNCEYCPDSEWPSEWDVGRMIDQFKIIKAKLEAGQRAKVLFHCRAGVSRSTAAAFIFLVTLGWDYEKAYEHVRDRRRTSNMGTDIMSPNPLMIKHADNIFQKNGEMLKLVCDKLECPDYPIKWGMTLDLAKVKI